MVQKIYRKILIEEEEIIIPKKTSPLILEEEIIIPKKNSPLIVDEKNILSSPLVEEEIVPKPITANRPTFYCGGMDVSKVARPWLTQELPAPVSYTSKCEPTPVVIRKPTITANPLKGTPYYVLEGTRVIIDRDTRLIIGYWKNGALVEQKNQEVEDVCRKYGVNYFDLSSLDKYVVTK